MDDLIYLNPDVQKGNEPPVPKLVRNSFVFLPTTGMRLAPEVLVLELMRELFFREFSDTAGEQQFDKIEHELPLNQRAVLHAFRGRRKMTKGSQEKRFFAPGYPFLAANAWLRKQDAKVIRGFLFQGAICQSLWHKGPDAEDMQRKQSQIGEELLSALRGSKSYYNDSPRDNDILAVTLGREAFLGAFGLEASESVGRFQECTKFSESVMRVDHDELAQCITDDLVAVCRLERTLPRMQWMQVLMTFLRFALPMWVLAHMRITRLLRTWLVDAIDGKDLVGEDLIVESISERNRRLLHPTLTATRELIEHTEQYMQSRIELSILLYCLKAIKPDELGKDGLSLEERGQRLSVGQLLRVASAVADELRGTDRYKMIARGEGCGTFLAREAEQFTGWRNPITRGQGKNIDEFFRVLQKADAGDEAGGCLLNPEGRGASRGFKVFPGQLLLKTVTYLAGSAKRRNDKASGKLVLQDIESRFAQYGVDFSDAAAARPRLLHELHSMGMLKGSPDAGSSVAVASPYLYSLKGDS